MRVLAFLEGTPAYNAVNLAVGVVSLLLTIGSIIAAARAARSAAAARSEAEAARRQIAGFAVGIGLSDIRGYLREAVARLDAGNADATLPYLAVAREQVARYSRLAVGPQPATPEQWTAIAVGLGDLAHAIRQRYAVSPPPTRLEVADMVDRVSSFGARLATIQAIAESQTLGP